MSYGSATEAANSALVKVGADPLTDYATDTTRAAQVVRRQYPIKLDALLRMGRWRFAMTRRALSLDATAPPFGFTYRFRLPADCIKVVGIFDENEDPRNYTSAQSTFKIETDATNGGRYLLQDDSACNLFYIRRMENTREWDPLFGEAFAWYLANDLSYFLGSADPGLRKFTWGCWRQAMTDAKAQDAFEGTQEVLVASSWLDARGGGNMRFSARSGWVV